MFWTAEITMKNVLQKNVKIGFEIEPTIILKPAYDNSLRLRHFYLTMTIINIQYSVTYCY